MSTSISPERAGEGPQIPEELVAGIGFTMLNEINTNLRLQALSTKLEFDMFAAQARYEAEAWGKMMQKLRDLNTLA